MKFSKPKLSNLTDKAKKLIDSPMKKTVMTTLAIAAVAFHPNPVALADNSKLTSVSTNNTINENSNDQSNQYMNLQLGSHNKYIPGFIFQSSLNNENKVKTIENALQLKAAAITIDGKPIVYLKNKDTAQEVIRQLKLQYVAEDQLKEFEMRSTAHNTELPPLKDNETRILNIYLSKNVSVEIEKIAPNKIVSADQAVSLLQKGTMDETKYSVKEGDVLGSIAQNYQLPLAELLALNPGLTADSVLKIGQQLTITVPKPFVKVIVEKEVKMQESIPFQTEISEDSSMANGETKVTQEGQTGLQSSTYSLSEENGVAVKKEVTEQEILKQPVNRLVTNGTKVIPSRGDGSFGWPTVGGYISSTMGYRWGKLHKGIDIAGPGNLTIKAADNGVVSSAGWDNGGYGNKIVINHQNGFTTVYAHLSSISVSAGQNVEKGSAIGIMGATGDATGVHLHFEVYKNGALQDPLNYISQR